MNELRRYFPDFLWLLRDVTLQPTDSSGSEISAKDYLMKRVLVRGETFDESASDKVGRVIITFFPHIDCVTLPPPSVDSSVMREIESNVDKLSPDFNKQISDLVKHLKQKVTTKKVFDSGEAVTGPLLACLTKQFVEDVNNPNKTPALANVWESTIKILINEVQERLKQEYTQEFTEAMKKASTNDNPLEEGDISGEGQSTMTTIFGIHHALIISKSAKLIEEVGNFCVAGPIVGITQEQIVAEFKMKIIEVRNETFEDEEGKPIIREKVIGGVLFSFVQENYKRSQKYCSKVFEDIYKPIQDKIRLPGDAYNFQNLRDDLQKIYKKYVLNAIGPAKWEVYDNKKEVIETDKAIFERLAGYEERLLKSDIEIADVKRRNQQACEEINQLRQQLEDKTNENQENIEQIKLQHAEVIKRLENENRKREEVEQQKYKEFLETQRQMHATRLANDKEIAEKNQETMQQIVKQHTDEMDKILHEIKNMKSQLSQQKKGKSIYEMHNYNLFL